MPAAWLKRISRLAVETSNPDRFTAPTSMRESKSESIRSEGPIYNDPVSVTARLRTESKSVREPALSSADFRLCSATEVAAQHAKWLAQWIMKDLGTAVGNDRVLLTTELQVSYSEMCLEMKIPPRPWNAVAAKFSVLIRQPNRPIKTYTDRINKAGKKQRLRCYAIPLPS